MNNRIRDKVNFLVIGTAVVALFAANYVVDPFDANLSFHLGLDKEPVAMSISEASHQAGVSRATLYALANRGQLPGCRRIGTRLIIHRKMFEDWLKAGSGE